MPLGENASIHTLSLAHQTVISEVKIFAVENIRTARRYLKKIDKNIVLDALQFIELKKENQNEVIQLLLQGNEIALMSEAGMPCIADPGAEIVALCHHYDIEVLPYAGPSAIMMALMASGLGGQLFQFCGYLPAKSQERMKAIQKLREKLEKKHSDPMTYLFIEAPYRNVTLFRDLLRYLPPHIWLCIAVSISADNQWIKTFSIAEWRKKEALAASHIEKQPTVFCLSGKICYE